MMKKTEGFSLIELLVVVAIIGVLAAVGVVGYQQYIDNAKADVTKTNAQSLERWIISTQLARSGGLTVKPADCAVTSGATAVSVDTCFDDTMVSANGPLDKFKNPYNTGTAAPVLLYHTIATAPSPTATVKCSTLTTNKKITAADGTTAIATVSDLTSPGTLVVGLLGSVDDLRTTGNNLYVGYCDSDGAVQVVTTDIRF